MKTFRSLLLAALATAVACSNGTSPTGEDGGTTTSAGGSSGGSAGGSTGGGSTSGGSSGGTTGAGGLGSPCTAPASGGTDPCAAAGYACTPSSDTSTQGTCQLPGSENYCLPNVGCIAGDTCLEISTSPVKYGCFQSCGVSTDCTVISSSCQKDGTQGICNANTCGPGLPSGYPTSGPTFYGPCNAVGTDDGICLPYDYTGVGTIGLCFAGSPADAGLPGACSLDRSDGGVLCPLGTFCLPDPTTGNSACEPLCANGGPDGGPSCAADSVCLGVSGGPYFGFCLAQCTSATACPTGQACSTEPGEDAGPVCAP